MKFLQKKHHTTNEEASTTFTKQSKEHMSNTSEQEIHAATDNNGFQAKLLQSPEHHIFCTVRPPWTWIMNDISDVVNEHPQQAHMTLMETYQELPSGKIAASNTNTNNSTPSKPNRIKRRQKTRSASATQATLRVDVVENNNNGTGDNGGNETSWKLLQSFHGTSEAFDGLEDKDEFVRTLKRCRCEHLELSPPSVLINWDVSATECHNLVGDSMPALLGNDPSNPTSIGVLKEPMGKSGAGVFFVHNAQEIHEIMERNRKRAAEETGFLDDLIAQKGRIPSWVLQAEVKPCLLVRDRRKFHIRTYVACIENVLLEGEANEEDLMRQFIYDRHEIRIANGSVPEEETTDRDRNVHIMDATAERKLIREEPELLKRSLNKKVELFAAQIFGKHLRPDIERRIAMSASMEEENNGTKNVPHKFVVAGLDIMVTEDERIYLLEVNVNPSAPTREFVSPQFQKYLLNFQSDLIELVTTRGESAKWPNSRFVSTESVLKRKL